MGILGFDGGYFFGSFFELYDLATVIGAAIGTYVVLEFFFSALGTFCEVGSVREFFLYGCGKGSASLTFAGFGQFLLGDGFFHKGVRLRYEIFFSRLFY
jgi:hypothetical protein